MEIAAKTKKLLEGAGIGTDPESILEAGLEGLTAVSGIGEKTANELLDAAKAEFDAPVPPDAPRPPDEPTPPDPEPPAEPVPPVGRVPPVEEPEAAPDFTGAKFEVRLVGRSSAVVDHVTMRQGNTRPIGLEILKQTVEAYPAGTFEARYDVGEGWSDWKAMPPETW